MNDLLLTGIPRSGTSLAAALLDRMDDTVCLSEPDEHLRLMEQSKDASDFVARLHRSMQQMNRRLRDGEAVPDRRQPDGSAVTNYFAEPDAQGQRSATYVNRAIEPRALSADMLLCVKHNALYAGVLPELVQARSLRIVAMVRDPVAVLHSWRSLALPISAGQLPAANRYWPEMRRLTSENIPLLAKQIRIYDLICQRFIDCGPGLSLLRYEDLIGDCAVLATAAGRKLSPAERAAAEHLIDRTYLRRGTDGYLSEAIRSTCRQGKANSLLQFYPDYA